jgi:large subunit ribosomal protein L35
MAIPRKQAIWQNEKPPPERLVSPGRAHDHIETGGGVDSAQKEKNGETARLRMFGVWTACIARARGFKKNERIIDMPKMKTNRGAAKRFKVTGKGKIAYSKSFASHILTKKSTKRKRRLRKTGTINKVDMASVKRLIPYA